MPKVLIAIGSNTEARTNIAKALSLLSEIIKDLRTTRLYDNMSVEGPSCMFTNALVSGTTSSDANQISKHLKDIELICGRQKEDKAKGIIRIDLDLLLFDSTRFHENDWEKDYIKLLYSELIHQTSH